MIDRLVTILGWRLKDLFCGLAIRSAYYAQPMADLQWDNVLAEWACNLSNLGVDRLPFTIIPNQTAIPANERAVLLEDPGFGRIFTDHMVTINWTEGLGWHSAEVRARTIHARSGLCGPLPAVVA